MGTIIRIPQGQENVELVERADEGKLSSLFLPDCLTADEPIKLKFKKEGRA